MAINERLVHTASAAAAAGGGTGNQEEGLILHLDANDVDSYDGDGSIWYDIKDHEYTPATNVSEHFNTVLYGGDGSTSNSITGIGFEPDFLWIAGRNAGNYNAIQDSIRGVDSVVFSALTNEEQTSSWRDSYGQVTGFDNDGFTVSGGSGNANSNFNQNGANYVAWCFKAGGVPSGSDKVSIDGTSYATMSAASLTDGTEAIDKLSVNTELGFSIVKYTAPALTADTVAHGLGEIPEMIILKSTSVNRNWNVFHKDVGASKNLHLNTTDDADTGEYWTVNPTTFSIQDYSASADWIAYCFASKRGVSKVGSFQGTGAAGNKIYTGFEPAFILTKRSSSSGASWAIIDNVRSTDSDKNDYLQANSNATEAASSSGITFDRDGFTFNGGSFNTSGATHIYYAVAKNTNETELVTEESNTTSYSFDGTENFYDYVSSITSTSTSGVFNSTSLQDSTATVNFGDNGATEANNTVNFTMSQPVSTDGFTVGENEQSYRGYTGTCKFYGSVDGTTFTLLGSTQQKSSGFGINPTRTAKTANFSATTPYSYFKMTLSNMERGTYGNIWDFVPSVADNDFDITTTTGGTSVLHLDAADFDGSTNTPTTWADKTYNGNNGTITGATFDSELGNSLDFDGVNDYVSVPSTSSTPVDFSAKNYTIEAWINPNTTAASADSILSKYGTNDSLRSIQFSHIDSKKLQLYERGTGTAATHQSTSIVALNRWTHVAVTRTSSQVKFYIDGSLDATISSTFTPNNGGSHNINIGSQANGNYNFFDGKIGQVRVYSSALTQDEIRQNFNFTKPSYPNGNNGTITGASWNPAGYFDFDGSGDSINLGSDLEFTINSSIALWINPTTKGGNRGVISKWQGSTPYGWILNQQNGGNLEFFFYSGSSFKKVDVGIVSTGSWSYIVITYDGDNLKAYLNDTLANTTSNINSLEPNDNSTSVLLCSAAISGITTQQFNGKISDVKIYDKALTSAEVTAQHSIGYNGIG